MYNSVAVFCGSKSGVNPIFMQHALELGTYLANSNITLVYGGGNVGLMGAVANAVLHKGGRVIGIMPQVLADMERQHQTITELKIVPDMHERKRIMYHLCDAAIILPGGNGTLDELFEMITWNTLKIHDKKIILLNSAGYYNHLIQHIEQMYAEGFLYDAWQDRIKVFDTPQAIFSFLDGDKN